MDAVFLKLIELSIIGSCFVLAVILLRLVFRNAPKWVFCLLWGMVALRLIVPVQIESKLSLVPDNVSEKQIASQMAQSYVGDVTYIHEGGENYQAAVDAGRKPIQSGGSSYVITQEGSLEEPQTVKTAVLPVLSRIWIAGVIIMLGYTLISYLTLRRKVSAATLFQGNIKESEHVDSPFVLGLIRPVIYLPYGLDDRDRENVVAHERAHIQRKDHWWKPIGFLILSVYWFNPVMWLAYILLCRDIEGACDEKVIKKLDKDGIRAYSTALLNCSVHRRSIAACPLAFGEVGVKERIKRVMHYKKPAFWIVLLALIASVAAAVLLLTNPAVEEQLLMGAYYRKAELLYTNKQEQTQVFHRFCITADYRLLAQKQNSEVWNLNEKLEKYPLTAEELETLTDYKNGWHRAYKITEIKDAYILSVENNYFYLIAKTKSGDILLGFGGADRNGNPGDKSLRYLYRLESEFEPGHVDWNFIAQSLPEEAGAIEIIEVWESEENPGYLLVGFLAGYNHNTELGYDDMGFAVFQTDGTAYRLLSSQVYTDAVYAENGIFICPDPAVLSQDEELKENTTYDVILSCNEALGKIQREYYQADKLIHSVASMQMDCPSMHIFSWDIVPKADTVTQVFLDKMGNELTVKTTEEIILDLVNRIALNPAMATSSNPYDYIRDQQELFDEILSYGDAAVNYMVDYLHTSMEDGLKEYIMAAACAEITGIGKDKAVEHWFTGKHWLDIYQGDYRPIVVGRPEDESGSLQVDSLLGIDCVWVKVAQVEDHPYKQGVHRYSYHFYYFGDGKKYDSGQQEQYLLWIENCLEYRMGDYDNDGIVELFVYTDAPDTPYELYDLEGSEIIVEKFSLVPDTVMDYKLLLDADGYYLYEERWAWFFKDPATYVAEVAKRPEDQLYYICPSGIIPAYTDGEVIDAAIAALHKLLDGMPTDYEKKIIYKLLNEIQLSYLPQLAPGADFNYGRLLEQWCATSEMSTEYDNCLQQISDIFDADPMAFLKGVAAVDQSELSKDIQPVISWLVDINYLHNPNTCKTLIDRIRANADGESEKKLSAIFQEALDGVKKPYYDTHKLLGYESADLWRAFFCNPDKTLDVLGSCNAEQLKPLGQTLWGMEHWPRKLLDKGYAAVDRMLGENPQGTRKDVAYQFLLALEWEGNYSQEYMPGSAFDYRRLFEKATYADGAMATMCYTQMYDVFEADPDGFMTALAQGEWDAENIALHFANQYRADAKYLETLNELLENVALKDCVQTFITAYQEN